VNIKELWKEKTSDIVVLIGAGTAINDITPDEWKKIGQCDTLAMNNFVYFPDFIPKWNSLELKHYDFQNMKDRIDEKWEQGWKNVGFILPENRADFMASAIGHPREAKIYTYRFVSRVDHPRINPNSIVDANFNPDDGNIYKTGDATTSTMIHLLYMMGYKYIIMYGFSMTDSFYYWSSGDAKYGKTYCLTNKDHEGKDPKKPHNAAHMKEYTIDFNRRHMLPKGREILIGDTNTALHPHLNLWRW